MSEEVFDVAMLWALRVAFVISVVGALATLVWGLTQGWG